MSLLPDSLTLVRDVFNGAILRLDAYSVPASNGLYSQNVIFLRGQFQTRYGHSTVFATTTDGPISALYNWVFEFYSPPLTTEPLSIAVYYAPNVGVRGYEQAQVAFTPILMAVTGAAGAVLVGAGARIYGAFYDATGRLGTAGGEIYGWNIGTDPLFAAPLQSTLTFSEPSTGVVTAGAHNFGFLFTTRNGYTGKLSPVDNTTTFVPVSFTASRGQNLAVTIATSPLPSYMAPGGTFQVVMTTAANPNRYYAVPGAISLAGTSVTITVNISDDDLAATGTDVTAYMNLLTSTYAGLPPFLPSAIFAYSSRMAYVTIDGAGVPVTYFSEPNNFQYITADQHGIYLEGNAAPVHGFSLRGVCYIGTQFSIYSVEDNGDVPASWQPPQKVDGSIGILSPTCITVNPTIGYAGIASPRGLYIFQGGIFPALPISYYQQNDWNRINWNVPTTVQVVDDQLNKRFIVLSPLTSTVASVSGTGPYTVTTSGAYPHLYQSGITIKVAGVTGTPTITVTGPNTFTIPGGSGAPAAGATIYPQVATHQMTWDYTEGDTPEEVKYSLNSFADYICGAVTNIQNLETYLPEVWYAPAANGNIIRQNDGSETHPYRDPSTSGNAANAISWFYQTSLCPNRDDPSITLHFFHGMHLRAKGTSPITIQALGLDGNITTTPPSSPLQLSVSPGKEYLVKWYLMSEQQSIMIGGNTLDMYAIVSLIREYYNEVYSQR